MPFIINFDFASFMMANSKIISDCRKLVKFFFKQILVWTFVVTYIGNDFVY